jgi:hypothetical protein
MFWYLLLLAAILGFIACSEKNDIVGSDNLGGGTPEPRLTPTDFYNRNIYLYRHTTSLEYIWH